MGGLASVVPLVLVAGCQFAKADPVSDGGDDGAGGDSPQGLCFGGAIERVCLVALPTMPVSIADDQRIDTGSSPLCVPVVSATVDACVVAGASIDISGNLTGVGSRPLVLVSLSHVSVIGRVDVSSRLAGTGAGANGTHCRAGTPPAQTGGGAGGSFGGPGGGGGSGNGPGGISASAEAVAAPLRGGCAGQSLNPAAETAGGGAVDFIAAGTIEIRGVVDASGAGGSGGSAGDFGGAGGGSGGTIAFDAPMVVLDTGAQVFANGGGGGGGGTDTQPGTVGSDPTQPTQPAPGGAGGGNQGTGGDGSAGATLNGSIGSNGAGAGGGGGGGAGMIGIDTPSLSSTAAVSPSLHP